MDNEERAEPASSTIEDPGGVVSNIVLVVNPVQGASGEVLAMKSPAKINLRNMFLYDDGCFALAAYVQVRDQTTH